MYIESAGYKVIDLTQNGEFDTVTLISTEYNLDPSSRLDTDNLCFRWNNFTYKFEPHVNIEIVNETIKITGKTTFITVG